MIAELSDEQNLLDRFIDKHCAGVSELSADAELIRQPPRTHAEDVSPVDVQARQATECAVRETRLLGTQVVARLHLTPTSLRLLFHIADVQLGFCCYTLL